MKKRILLLLLFSTSLLFSQEYFNTKVQFGVTPLSNSTDKLGTIDAQGFLNKSTISVQDLIDGLSPDLSNYVTKDLPEDIMGKKTFIVKDNSGGIRVDNTGFKPSFIVLNKKDSIGARIVNYLGGTALELKNNTVSTGDSFVIDKYFAGVPREVFKIDNVGNTMLQELEIEQASENTVSDEVLVRGADNKVGFVSKASIGGAIIKDGLGYIIADRTDGAFHGTVGVGAFDLSYNTALQNGVGQYGFASGQNVTVGSNGIGGGAGVDVGNNGIGGGNGVTVAPFGIGGGNNVTVAPFGIGGGNNVTVGQNGIGGGYNVDVGYNGIGGGYNVDVGTGGIGGGENVTVGVRGIGGGLNVDVGTGGIGGGQNVNVGNYGIGGGENVTVGVRGIGGGLNVDVGTGGIGGGRNVNVAPYGIGGGENVNVGYYGIGSGSYISAPSYGETAHGSFNTEYTPNSTTTFNINDRLFSLGNGTSINNRSVATEVWKDGRNILDKLIVRTLDEDNTATKVLVADDNGKVGHQNKNTYWTGDNATLSKNIDGITLADNITVTGSYRPAAADPSNPLGLHSHIAHYQHPNTNDYAFQLMSTYGLNDGRLFYRNEKAGNWSTAKEIYTTGSTNLNAWVLYGNTSTAVQSVPANTPTVLSNNGGYYNNNKITDLYNTTTQQLDLTEARQNDNLSIVMEVEIETLANSQVVYMQYRGAIGSVNEWNINLTNEVYYKNQGTRNMVCKFDVPLEFVQDITNPAEITIVSDGALNAKTKYHYLKIN